MEVNKPTETQERLIAKEIATTLSQKGVSYGQACDILEDVQNILQCIPLVDITKDN